MDYLKSFIIGSSAFVFVPFYFGAKNLPGRRFSMERYPVTASLYFGIMNMMSLFIGNALGLTLTQRLILITVLSTIIVSVTITINVAYEFKSSREWIRQYFLIALSHSFTYLITINLLERALSQ